MAKMKKKCFWDDQLQDNKICQKKLLKKWTPKLERFVEMGYERAKFLTEKIDDLHKLAKALLVYETLTGSEIEDLINKNTYPAIKKT